MHTEQDFTAAMERAVAKRGADWKYPAPANAEPGFYVGTLNSVPGCPSYQDGFGNPTCLIAVAMFELGMRLPVAYEAASALKVLDKKVPNTVRMAARAAQIHQDSRNTWGECLAVYNQALAIAMAIPTLAEPRVNVIYHQAVDQARGRATLESSIERMRDQAAMFQEMKQVTMTVSEDFEKVIGAWTISSPPSMTFSISAGTISGTAVSLMTGGTFTYTPPPKKSEHELIA